MEFCEKIRSGKKPNEKRIYLSDPREGICKFPVLLVLTPVQILRYMCLELQISTRNR